MQPLRPDQSSYGTPLLLEPERPASLGRVSQPAVQACASRVAAPLTMSRSTPIAFAFFLACQATAPGPTSSVPGDSRAEADTQPSEVDTGTGNTGNTGGTGDTEPQPRVEEPEVQAPEPLAPVDPLGPLSDETRTVFEAIQADPKPAEITRNSHYWVSNERSQFLWHDAVKGIGGAFIGVGTDQCYMLAGWAESDLLVLMDFDQAIVNLHQVYGVVLAKAETPAEFVELWTEENEAKVQGWIEAAYPDASARKPIARAHHIARKLVRMRLKRIVRQYPPLGIPTFVTDQGQYDHIKTLWANGRVFSMRGDLTADKAMQQIGQALSETKLELGLLYLSNAEQYFEYTPAFRRNVLSLPFSATGMVLRTLGWNSTGFVAGEEYHYNRQSGRNFQGWLKQSRVSKLGRLLRKKTDTDIPGNSILDREPEVSENPPEVAPEVSN